MIRAKLPRLAASAAVLAAAAIATGATLALPTATSPAADDDPTLRGRPVPATAAAPTTLATAPAPPPPAPPLPQPEPSPSDAYADVPVVAIGEIEIPKIGLAHTVYEGVWLTVVDHGPGHWPGTAAPGGWGNTVFAGHRVTNTHPFRRIDELVPGDEIIVRTGDGTFTYQMAGSQIVDEDGLHIVDQSPGHTITLFACHPPGSARYRYVVTGTLVRSDPP